MACDNAVVSEADAWLPISARKFPTDGIATGIPGGVRCEPACSLAYPDAFKNDRSIDGLAGLGETGHVGAAAQQIFFFEAKGNELDRSCQSGLLQSAGNSRSTVRPLGIVTGAGRP